MKYISNILISIIITVLIAFSIKTFIIDPQEKKLHDEKLLNLINIYFQEKDFETAKGFAQEFLYNNLSDNKAIDLYNKILIAEREEKSKYDLKELKEIEKLIASLRYKVERLSSIKPVINNANTRVIDEYELGELIKAGIGYYKDRRYAEAINKFEIALKMDENNVEANSFLGASLFEMNPENDKSLEASSRYCMKALEYNKTNELAHLTLGRIYEQKNMDTDAINELKEVIRINPNNYYAFFYLGRIYFNEKNYQEALDYFTNLLNMKKDFDDGYYYLALVDIGLGKMEEAKNNLRIVLSNNAKFYKANVKLAEISAGEKDYKSSIKYYEKVLSYDRNYHYYDKTAECYLAMNDKNNAIESYAKSIDTNQLKTEKEKDDAEKAYERIVNLLLENGNNINALMYAEKAIDELKERSVRLCVVSGDLKFKTGRISESINDYQKALVYKVNNQEEIYCKLGDAYILMKDQNRAVSLYKRAIEINDNCLDGYYKLGKLYYSMGKYNEAKNMLKMILEKNPEYENRKDVDGMLKK